MLPHPQMSDSPGYQQKVTVPRNLIKQLSNNQQLLSKERTSRSYSIPILLVALVPRTIARKVPLLGVLGQTYKHTQFHVNTVSDTPVMMKPLKSHKEHVSTLVLSG